MNENVVQNLKMKTKGKSVEVIDLQLFSSLNWYDVYKKVTYLAGPPQLHSHVKDASTQKPIRLYKAL